MAAALVVRLIKLALPFPQNLVGAVLKLVTTESIIIFFVTVNTQPLTVSINKLIT